MLIQQLSLLISVAVNEIIPYITQLPACGRYHGNFTQRYDDKYFRGEVTATRYNVTRKECSLICVLHEGCLFINQKNDNSMCELMTSHVGEFEEKPGWQVASTDYSSYDRRGPMCQYIKPTCDYTTETCMDICEPPGFKCEKLVNVALNKEVNVSSTYVTDKWLGSDAVDGKLHSVWASKKVSPSWIVIDLTARYKIPFVTIVNHPKEVSWTRLRKMDIRIGDYDENNKDKNEICKENQNQGKLLVKRYICMNGPLVGRYVVVTRNELIDEYC